MATPFDEPIIEGFICPVCIKSFRTADVLHVHFEAEHKSHPIGPNDPNGVFSNTRSRNDSSPGRKLKSFAFYDRNQLTEQPACVSNSLTAEFVKLRRARVNRDALETNSLLIRLEKLINSQPMSKLDRKEFEQSVVHWIDGSDIDLCPSCGKTFGLGLEEAYPLDKAPPNSLKPNDSSGNLISAMAIRSKHTLARITNAILDYNPVYRRRHHCRLCGHILCADCSIFLTRGGALRILNAINLHQLGDFSSTIQHDTERLHPDVQPDQLDPTSFPNSNDLFLPTSKCSDSLLDFERGETDVQYLRVCAVCKDLLQRKLDRVEFNQRPSPIITLHGQLREHMRKVNEALPLYSAVAESLHSGEQRYALDVAQTMRHDLLESLQQIDAIRRRLDDMMSPKPNQSNLSTPSLNLATIRLLRTLSKMSCQFLQTNLPPLRALPTLHQYGSLTAQRQSELEARWAEEERTLAQLELRVAQATRSSPSSTTVTHQPNDPSDSVNKLSQLAATIDAVSGRLIRARSIGDARQAHLLLRQLEQLETDFQKTSDLVRQRQF